MYLPKVFEQPDIAAMHGLIGSHPFATLVTHGSEGLSANHIPFELAKEPLPYGTLFCHVSRSNPLCREAVNGAEALVVFQGPNAYITPSWYPSKVETGKVVPTWNYVVVHAHGRLRAIDDVQRIRTHIEHLTDHQETAFSQPWTVSDAPADFTEKLIGSVVGIEMIVTRLVGKWKISQNQPERNRTGVAAGLRSMGASPMAELIERGVG